MKVALGILMLVGLFGGLTVVMARDIGVGATAACWGATLALTAVVVVAALLIGGVI